MEEVSEKQLLYAVQEFQTARIHAALEQIFAEVTGRSADLLSYDEVREQIGGRETPRRTLKEIPLEAIVGSVGRYQDFTRRFLPLVDQDRRRWAQVWARVETMDGLPPIEVFQIGDVYFVRDGNHRVSVARRHGFSHIEAYVTEVDTSVPPELDDNPEDLILKARYARFLEKSCLDTAVPDCDLSMSAAGNYRVLENQISQHQHRIEADTGRAISYPDAAHHWYKEVYWPVVQFVRRRGLMRDFPGRTETDLYVWIDRYRRELATQLGWTVDAETAVLDLAEKQIVGPKEAVQKLGAIILDAITPDALEAGPTVGQWRESWLATYREDRLFSHILVAIDGQDAGWHALQQAARVAQREEGKIFGLHVVSTAEAAASVGALEVEAEFERRCRDYGVAGEMTIATGPVTGTICYRARWADLVVVSLSHPPGPQPVDRLSSQFGQLLRRCSRPVLAVPRTDAGMDRILLAFDGSPKGSEALAVAAYLAGHWQVPLVVVVALGRGVTEKTADRARVYLNRHNVQAEWIVKRGRAAARIIAAARQRDCGLVLMGGYGLNPVLEIVAGSVVDEVLRTRNRPVLVCR